MRTRLHIALGCGFVAVVAGGAALWPVASGSAQTALITPSVQPPTPTPPQVSASPSTPAAAPAARTAPIRPIVPVRKFTITGQFGEDRGDHRHAGLDMAAPTGRPIIASLPGTVVQASDRGDGYGNCVIVRHAKGSTARYAHMDTIKVRRGQTVSQGQLLGTVGSTGHSTGPHLHLEFTKNHQLQDPAKVLWGASGRKPRR